MVQVSKSGQIMLNMKVNGEKIKLMAVENSGMQMVISMRENGKTIKPMVMVYIYMLMVHNMKAIGKMIFKMDKAWKAGKMEADTTVVTKKV